jgi:hypothetical protein
LKIHVLGAQSNALIKRRPEPYRRPIITYLFFNNNTKVFAPILLLIDHSFCHLLGNSAVFSKKNKSV